MFGITAIDIAIFVLVAAALFGAVDIGRRVTGYDPERRTPRRASRRESSPVRRFRPRSFHSADQLRCVMAAEYKRKRLLSHEEARVFFAVERTIGQLGLPWRVMAQVNLGEILSCGDAKAFAAINSKRVDILVITNGGYPLAAIEYQGTGHHQGTAAARDAVKKEALRRAGVDYIEVLAGDWGEQLKLQLARLATHVEGKRRFTA